MCIITNGQAQNEGVECFNSSPSHCKRSKAETHQVATKKMKIDHCSSIRNVERKRITIRPSNEAGRKQFSCTNRINDNKESLHDFFSSMMATSQCMLNPNLFSYKGSDKFFFQPTEAEIEAYKVDILSSVTNNDMEALRKFHKQGRPLKCSNKFGESILHIACRKGILDVATFLIDEVNVPLFVRDDVGRSPLHDACWAAKPNFDIIELVVRNCPDLLYISDRRGHSPLMYVRQEHWIKWKTFLSSKDLSYLLPKTILS